MIINIEGIKAYCQTCEHYCNCPWEKMPEARHACILIPLHLTAPAWVISEIEMMVLSSQEVEPGDPALYSPTEN